MHAVMAAPKENLLSLGQLTGKEGNTFTKQRRHGLKNSVNRPQLLQADFSTPQAHQQLRAMHLQQHWQELKERELTAQQHNRQLLQQFEEAQGTLREMLALTVAMKTIRMEYERFLEENSPRWQQQLKEKTAAAQKKRMEEYLKSCPKNTAPRVMSSADGPLLSQVAGSSTMAQTIAAPPKHYSPNSHLDYNQHGSPHLSYMQSSWPIHQQSQIARFPIRAAYQPQGSSPVPPSFLTPNTFPYAHSLPLQHLTSTTADHHPRPRYNPPGWASLQPDYPWSWAPGLTGIPSDSEALWGQLYMEEPPLEMGLAQEETDTSRAQSSKRERGGGGGGSHLSQELDIKPVRLSGGLAESRGSSRESSQGSRVKRKKREERGRSHCSSSDRESCSSQESSRCSNAIAAVTVAQSSKSNASSEKSRSVNSGRTGGLAVGLSRAEKVGKESKGDDPGSHKEESHSTSEEVKSFIEESGSVEAENQSPDDKSESLGEESGAEREEESGCVSVKTANRSGDEIEKVESSRSEQSSVGEKDEDDLGDNGGTGEKEKHQTDEEQEESHIKGDDEPSVRKNTTDEEETGAEDEAMEQESEVKGDREEQSDRLKNEDGENGKKDSSSSKEEEEVDESEGDESDEEEQGDLAGEPDEERDSDSIISPQDRSKTMHIIPKDTSEEDEEENESEGDEDNMEEGESDGLKSEDGENGNKGSSSSQEEEADESEGDEDNMEDEESDEEEQRGDLAGQPDEEGDSDNSIISPQDRSKRMHIIPEEATEDEEESKRGSSGDDSQFSDEDDAEHLLALHQQSQKKEVKDLKAAEKPKAICDNVEIFQVETDQSTKSDHPSDSDEFDNFYG